jgi:hypothetical protein
MASQNPIHTLSTPNPVATPRAKPVATTARSVGYGRSSGLSDHSGRQGRIMSITPSVAHKNTNRSTPMRRSHRRAAEGEGLATETDNGTSGTGVSVGDLSPPTPLESLAKGRLGSEIIARVVSKAVSTAVGWAQDRVASRRKFRTHFVHSTTSEPECARPRRDNRYSNRTRW